MSYNIGLPVIYPANTTDFLGGGYGALPDGIYCRVTEVINGAYELEMQYPITGNNANRLQQNNIIACKPNPYDAVAYFRIYRITRPINGEITVYGEHIHYLVNGYVCKPNTESAETASSCGTFMQYLENECAAAASAMGSLAFEFSTDIVTSATWAIQNPITVEDAMKYAVEVFGGEWYYDGLECILKEQRGEDRHVQVRYGSNMTAITSEETDTDYSHVMPYYSDGDDFVYATGDYVAITGLDQSTKHKKAKILNLSAEFDETPSASELANKANEVIAQDVQKQNRNNVKVSFVPRGQTLEYAHLYDIDHVELGDPINASADHIGVNQTLRCNKTVYDAYSDLYSVAELGEVIPSTLNEAIRAIIKGSENTNPVWYSDDHEPTENIKAGDFWVKIDDDTNRTAQQLAEYKGGQWFLHCEFPQGGGVGENVGYHNERFNGYETADGCTISGNSNYDYNHAEGYKNNLSYCKATHINGSENHTQNTENSFITGYHNKYTGSSLYSSIISGYNNGYSNDMYGSISGSIISGTANKIYSGFTCSIMTGAQNTISSQGGFSNGLLIGVNNTITGSNQQTLVVGDHHTIKETNGAIVFGRYADVTSSSSFHSTPAMVLGGGSGSGNTFYMTLGGALYAAGGYNAMGADYAELFEWLDGNANNEDRRGYLVSLDGDKIIPAHGDDIFGIISANPSIIGNNPLEWHGKYKKDAFGSPILDENGEMILSDEYDPNRKYIPRDQRPEWAAVGLVGRLIIVDNGSCKVGGYVSARHGIGTACFAKTAARVLKRIDDNHIEVLIK